MSGSYGERVKYTWTVATKVGAYVVADKDNPSTDEQTLLTALRKQFHIDLVDDDDVASAKMDFTAYSAIVVGDSSDVAKLGNLTDLVLPIVFTKGEHAATIGRMATVGVGNYGTSTGTEWAVTNNSHPTMLTEAIEVHTLYTESGDLNWLLSTALATGVGTFANVKDEATHISLAILPIDGINSDGVASPEIRYFFGLPEPSKYTDHSWEHAEWIANWLVHQIALVTVVQSLTKSKIIEEMLGKGKFKKQTPLYDYLVHDTTGAAPYEVISEQEIGSVMERLQWIKNGLRRGTGTILPLNTSLYDYLLAIEGKLDVPADFMADVSALALEATLGTHDTDIKTLLGTVAGYIDTEITAIETKLDTPANFMADVSALALEATLATHDADIKTLIAALNDLSDAEVWAYVTRTLTAHAFPFTNPAAALDVSNIRTAAYGQYNTEMASVFGFTENTNKRIQPSPAIDSIFWKSGGAVCPAGKSIWDYLPALTNATYGLESLDTDLNKLLTGIIQGTGTVLPADKSLYDILWVDKSTDEQGSFNWDTSAYTTVEQDISALFTTALTGTKRRSYQVYLALHNVEGDANFDECYIRVYVKINGTYQCITEPTTKTKANLQDAPGVPIEVPMTAEDAKVTLQMKTALAVDKTIDYSWVEEKMEY